MKSFFYLFQLLLVLLLAPTLQGMEDGGPAATLSFDLNECASFAYNNTNVDYSEFTAIISNSPEIELAVVGNHLYRMNPQLNGHSCTPGLNETEAMCISYDPVCDYMPGSQRALRFDISVNPLTNEAAQLQKLSFQEKSPLMFDWIDGPSGSNNYPLKYGVRVLKNGQVIYDQGEFLTSIDWSLEEIDFSGIAAFRVNEPTVFKFELLAYCPIGVMALQSVWDVEDISVMAGCADDCPAIVDGATVSLANGATNYTGCAGDIVLDVTNNSISIPANYYYVITDANDNILAFANSANLDPLDLSGAPAGECHIWGWSQIGAADPIPGSNISSLNDDSCESISSNFITVIRTAVEGGTLTGGPFTFCVGDGQADNIPTNGITLTGNSGTNSQWVVTDDQGNILGLPPTFTAPDFDGAPAGNCLIWHLSYEDGLQGAEMGMNANNLQGCFSLSNPISVVRTSPQGGTLTGGPFTFCVGDGVADNIPTNGITLTGNSGTNSQWVVTDDQGNILGLPPTFSAPDFDGAPAGNCLIWHLSYEDGLQGAEMGMNANNLQGCFSLSNPITVVRTSPAGGTLTGGPFEFCVGDGAADNIPTNGITLTGNSGTNSQWVVTDDQGNILGLPPTFSAPDFDGAPAGNCLIWHLSYEDGLQGAEMGMNANNLQGCFSLSNPISVVRTSPQGGTLTGGPFTFCVGDGAADNIPTNGITLTGNSGTNSQWVVTDDQGNILGLPPTFSAPDFDGAPAGTCLIWHLSYEDGLQGAEMGMNANNLQGCFSLSNPITVVRTSPQGGTLTGGPFTFCVGDGVADNIPTNGITLTGNSGTNSQWVVTDDQGNILGLPPTFSAPDFDGAPAGNCLIWHLSYEDGLQGAEMGMNANNLQGCFSLSNPITVVRTSPQGGTLMGGPFTFCVGDGVADNIPTNGITLTGNSGTNSQWVVTDDQGNILGLPPTFSAPDFDGAPAGTCLIWHLSYEDGLQGAEMGMNANNLQGCFSLSNPISVVRTSPQGGTLTGGPFTFCVGDGAADNIPTNGITLTGNSGTNSQWVVTDDQGNILGLPPTFSAPDFDGAPAGTCLIWHLSYEDGLQGAEMGMNANNLQGCFSLSNPISVNRINCSVSGGTLAGGPFDFCVDGTPDMVSGITLSGTTGSNSAWIVTDLQGNILGLPPMPGAVDFDGAGAGVCLIWNISYEAGLTGLAMGNNVSGLMGTYGLSNSITVTRNEAVGGTLTGGPFNFEVDGTPDMVSGITLSGNAGTNTAWVITDPQGNILGLPPMPGVVDFDAAGVGVCYIYSISYEDGLTGLAMGNNLSALMGCHDLSNFITVTRVAPAPVSGGTLAGGPFEFCVDGVADNVSGITLTGNTGTNNQWIVTDPQGNILGLPPMPGAVDFDGAGAGVCLIWNISYEAGLTGLAMGNNVSGLMGTYGLSNSITVTRNEAVGGTLTGGPFNFEVDGTPDMVSGITLSGNAGTNTAWVITDPQGNILGLPPMPGVVDFDAAGVGVCYIYSISYEDGLTGLAMGNNLSALMGCHDLSNFITVTRVAPAPVSGGTLAGGPFEFCVDGVADNVSGITLTGNTGTNNQWIVTDPQGNILGLPPMPGAVDFDGAGAGVCLIWNISYEAGLTGLAMGNNVSGLTGTYGLSNSITVTRNEAIGGTLTGGPFTFNSIGDGVADMIPAGSISLNGNTGTNSQWVVTDSQGIILGLPPMPSAVDFDGAGSGSCLIWHLSYESGLTGLSAGMSAANLSGCFSLSNSVEVIRTNADGCNTNGGELFGGPFNFVVGDGIQDTIAVDSLILANSSGMNSQWVVTDSLGYILGLPPTFSAVDFDGAGYGFCLVWHLSYETGLSGLEMGMNANDLAGCFSLSNAVEVNRTDANGCNTNGGVLFGGPFEFCVGDGIADMIPAGSITLANSAGMNSQWVITDDQGNILGLPPSFTAPNFDDAPAGTCLVWHISYEMGLTGLEMGMNTSNLQGCFSLSNSVSVIRNNCGIVINEINSNEQIEIKNTGSTTVDISSYYLCNFPAYAQLSSLSITCGGDYNLEPGELVTVIADFDIDENDGELGLYLNTNYTDPTALMDYVEWGSTGHQRSPIAVMAGIWTTGDSVPAFSASEVIEYDGVGNSSLDWSTDSASPCQDNFRDNQLEFQFITYPNPSIDNISLKFNRTIEQEATIEIYDQLGQMKSSENISVNGLSHQNIAIQSLEAGSYLIKVTIGRASKVQKLIKL